MELVVQFKRVDDFKCLTFYSKLNDQDTGESYKTLVELEQKIKDLNLGTYNPIFVSEHKLAYITIRFNNSKLAKFKEHGLYQINISAKKSEFNDREYINFAMKSAKLLKEPIKINQGVEFNL